MTTQNKYKTLLDNTFLISLGTFGSKLMTFVMVRFYTGILTPSDYGTADLIMQTANLLLPVVSMGIANGVFRFALDEPERRKSIFSTGFYTITLGAVLLWVIVSLLSFTSAFRGYGSLIAIYTMASCYHSLCAQFVRAEGKTALFAGQGILNTALVIGLNILFLAVFQLGVTGYVLSVALADGLCTLYLVCRERLWRLLTSHPEKSIALQMLQYSIPLIPTTIFWWITSVSDRYMVTGFLGAQANGLYAVAYKIPTILTLLSTIFLEAWQFSAISEAVGDRKAHVQFYSEIWSSFLSVMFLAAGAVIAMSQIEIGLLSDAEYFFAWRYVPVLSVAMVFSAFASFTGSVYVVAKKSVLSFWTAMAGAILNIVLNLVLIPKIGVQGAAIATLSSYLLSFGIRAVSSRRLLPFRLYKGRLLANTLILLFQMLDMILELPLWPVIQALCLVLLLLINGKQLLAVAEKIVCLKKGI